MSGPAPGYEALPPPLAAVLARVQDLTVEYLRRYHRFELDGQARFPEEQVLIVANHGYGGLFDLNVAALLAAHRLLDVQRPTTSLVHQLAWTLRVGPFIEPFFVRPASRQAAMEGFARGHHVMVLPGGDLDAFKPRRDRNRIVFGGRGGFARLADDAGVPIVPVVTYGAGNSLLALRGGQELAKALGFDRLLRVKALPISVSVPWGFSIGIAGVLPYVPLPAKLRTRVLPPMRRAPGESVEEFAGRVVAAMQAALDDLAAAENTRR